MRINKLLMNQYFQYQNQSSTTKLMSPLSNMDSHSFSTNDQYSSAKVTKIIPKPDFSSIEKKETTLEYKEPGSYKKPKIIFPQTPIKSQKKTFNTTPGNLGRELFPFNSIRANHSSACRKLNFNMSSSEEEEEEEKGNQSNIIKGKEDQKVSKLALGLYGLTPQFLECLEEKDEENNTVFSTQNANNTTTMNYNQISSAKSNYCSNILSNTACERSGKFECEYFILKILSDKKGRKVYKCVNKNQKRICIIRKEKKLSTHISDNNTKAFMREAFNSSNSIFWKFCSKYDDSWEEKSPTSNDSLLPLFSSSPSMGYNDSICNTNHSLTLYSFEKYYQNGDLLDFLSRLESQNFNWNTTFYWDIVFEMMCGLQYLHQCGFVHFDIQPSNFYIDSNGEIKLGGLSHIHCYNNIINIFLHQNTQKLSIEDSLQRDSTYVAPELFNRSSLSEINFKCDVFSLGLSLLEIIGKIHLPQNGALWREIRTEGFELNQSFFSDWNENYVPFASLIQRMICVNVKDRPTIMDLMYDDVNFPELNKRYKMLLSNSYMKSDLNELMMHYLKKDNEEESKLMDFEDDVDMTIALQAKRSNSTRTFAFLD